jgi:hypothetical protein
MKKQILLMTAASVVALTSMAQVAPSTNKGGIKLKGGVNLANITKDNDGNVDDANGLTSFHVGAILDVPLSDFLSLQPGLLYTGKGSKTQSGQQGSTFYYKAKSNPMYVELPVNFVGKIPLTSASHFFFGAGPYAAVGVGGKNKVEGTAVGIAFNREEDIDFSDDDPTTSQEENAGYGKLKRFDYGFNVLTGVEFGKFSLGANYGYGLAKINSGASNREDDKNKHRVLSFSLGIKL